MIAETAAATDGALYRHFKSKNDIAQTIFNENIEFFYAKLLEISSDTQSLREKLSSILIYILISYRKDPQLFSFLLLNRPDFFTEETMPKRYPVELIRELIIEGQKDGDILDGNASVITALFWGPLLKVITQAESHCLGGFNFVDDTSHDDLIISSAINTIWKAEVL